MKAIQVNGTTFPKLEAEVRPIAMETIRQYYDALSSSDEEMFVIVEELEGFQSTPCRVCAGEDFFKNYILMTTQGDWRMFPNDWFEVRDKR